MTLEQLRIFLAVAEREHVTRAAEALNLTQSAVSAAISALETRHGVRLFDRIGRRILLSDAGRAFRPTAERVLAQAETAELALEDLAREPRGRLRIAASQTVASYWLPPRLLAFRTRHPRIGLALTVGNTASVAAAVAEGAADLGLVEGEVAQPGLHRQVVARDRLALVMAPGHRWATRDRVPVAEFPQSDWILREPGSGTRAALDALLGGAGLSIEDLEAPLELPSNEAVLAAVAAGGAVGLLSERAVHHAAGAGAVRALPLAEAERPFAALTHPGRHRTRALAAMLDLVTGREGAGREKGDAPPPG